MFRVLQNALFAFSSALLLQNFLMKVRKKNDKFSTPFIVTHGLVGCAYRNSADTKPWSKLGFAPKK